MSNHRRDAKLIVVASAATLLLATAVQAPAASKRVEKLDAKGGEARLIVKEKGYSLQARDTAKDGYGVVAYIYTKGRRDAAFQAMDTNGAGKGWAKTAIPAGALGRDVLLRVVVKDHNGNAGKGKNHLLADEHKPLRLG
jgi:opacity protein-like surface antigen